MISKISTPWCYSCDDSSSYFGEREIIYSHESFKSREFPQAAGIREGRSDSKGERELMDLTDLKKGPPGEECRWP